MATVPDDAVGGVLGDLAARRGRVSGSTARGRHGGDHHQRPVRALGRRTRHPLGRADPGLAMLRHVVRQPGVACYQRQFVTATGKGVAADYRAGLGGYRSSAELG
jgi:hypothetical protein